MIPSHALPASGYLTVTNQRIIFVGSEHSFDLALDNIINCYCDNNNSSASINAHNRSYRLKVSTQSL